MVTGGLISLHNGVAEVFLLAKLFVNRKQINDFRIALRGKKKKNKFD
jgi:hypothetical protein